MRLIRPENLQAAIAAILEAAGCASAEADLVAEHMIGANLAGHDSHGAGLIPLYIEHLQNGLIKPGQHAEVVRDDGAILVIEGHMGFGQVIAREATELAIDRAREAGVCVAALRNSHHIGRVGAWGEMCAEAGFVSIHYVNVVGNRSNFVAPFAGAERRFATNPYCCAIPAGEGEEPLVLDMATSKIAFGKVRLAAIRGEQLEPETIIDAEGRPSVDAGIMHPELKGALLPFGGYKGYGLALVCELLAGALSGHGTVQPQTPRDDAITNNMLSIVIDPARLVDGNWFESEVRAFIAYIRATRPADKDTPVLIPGDPERARRRAREETGVPMPDAVWENILQAADMAGLARPALEDLVA